jgi:hypothetical protein
VDKILRNEAGYLSQRDSRKYGEPRGQGDRGDREGYNRSGDRPYQKDERGYRDHRGGSQQPYHRDQRFGRIDRQVSKEVSLREGELKPMPDGKKCNPLCPYFKCSKKALGITRRDDRGRIKFVGFCNWANDLCIGGICQFSACEKFYLLPDGTCLYAVEQGRRSASDDMFREIEEEEMRAKKLKGLLSRKLGGRGFELE